VQESDDVVDDHLSYILRRTSPRRHRHDKLAVQDLATTDPSLVIMSAQAARTAGSMAKSAGNQLNNHVLNKGAKRDPELYVSDFALDISVMRQSAVACELGRRS
jgi:hypothetical protein